MSTLRYAPVTSGRSPLGDYYNLVLLTKLSTNRLELTRSIIEIQGLAPCSHLARLNDHRSLDENLDSVDSCIRLDAPNTKPPYRISHLFRVGFSLSPRLAKVGVPVLITNNGSHWTEWVIPLVTLPVVNH